MGEAERSIFSRQDKRNTGSPSPDRRMGAFAAVPTTTDPLCGYCFTVSGFKGLFGLLTYVSGNEWFDKVPDKLPILFTAGVDDPVGNYSKGVVYVYDKLKNSNHNEIDLKLWPGLRHEILNEKSNKEVYEYISSWTDGKI